MILQVDGEDGSACNQTLQDDDEESNYDSEDQASHSDESDNEEGENNQVNEADNEEWEDNQFNESDAEEGENNQVNEFDNEEREDPDNARPYSNMEVTPPAVNESNVGEDTVRGGTVHSITRAYITSLTKCPGSDNSTVKFEGLNINSKLVPTLRKIWSKHGDITENIAIRNGDIIARSLESLATAVQILEGNTAQSLDEWQADYLSSALSDLQYGRFKVDWLVSSIENALALTQPKNKPLVASLKCLTEVKAQISERIRKLNEDLADYDKMEKEIKGDMAMLCEKISIQGELELDKPLGEGLT